MKILVCTDGSKQSKKVVEEASKIAGGCNADEVAILYVYDHKPEFPYPGEGVYLKGEDIERWKKFEEEQKEDKKKILFEALQVFEGKNIKASTIFKEGHASETIVNVASEGGFDMIVIGSRGLGGLKKLFLGSVSNAVVQHAKASVLTIK